MLSTIPKKRKDLIKDFLLFHFPFNIKWAIKPFINQLNYQKLHECFLSILASILVYWTHMQVVEARELIIMENDKGYLVIQFKCI
jgi:hypothetical protein